MLLGQKLKLVLLVICSVVGSGIEAKEEVLVYHDADYSGHMESAESMMMGFNAGISEFNRGDNAYIVKLVSKDHRGNVKRSLLNFKKFQSDERALFVMGGLHSPPYLANKDYINEHKIPLIIPWAAAGPITRSKNEVNTVFRVSVDDTKAGAVLARYAIEQKACKAPHLLLENTGWGRSNKNTISSALSALGATANGITWFEWNTKENLAKQLIYDILQKNTDCLIFVGNAIEGRHFANAVISFPEERRLPIISHWGITGGNFYQQYREKYHGQLDLAFLQTCFSFNKPNLGSHALGVLAQARALYPDKIKQGEDIKAPPGFIHAYDIGLIVAEALKQMNWSGDIQKDRAQLVQSLENITAPVKGLVKTYHPPFQPWKSSLTDAHEALGVENLCLAEYDENGIARIVD